MNHSIDNINKTKENINNTNDEYKCYRCGYTHIKKHTLITHFNRKKPCKKYETNCLSDAEIDLLNHNQFKNKKDNTNKNIIKETKNSQENTYINIENQTIIINLIPFNEVIFSLLKRPSDESVRAFQDKLIRGGIRTTVRFSKGRDIQAACGQLIRNK